MYTPAACRGLAVVYVRCEQALTYDKLVAPRENITSFASEVWSPLRVSGPIVRELVSSKSFFGYETAIAAPSSQTPGGCGSAVRLEGRVHTMRA